MHLRREAIGYFEAAEQRESMLRSRARGGTLLQMAFFPEQGLQEGFLSGR